MTDGISILNLDCYEVLRRRVPDLRLKKGLWLGLAALLLLFNLYAPAGPTLIERTLANAIILVAFGAIAHWQRCANQRPDFGFIPIVMIVFVLQFALPIFLVKIYATSILAQGGLDDPYIEKALALSLAGLLAMLAGYYAPSVRSGAAALLPQFQLRWHDKRAVEIAALFFGFLGTASFFATFILDIPREALAYLVRGGDFFFLAIIALVFLQLEGELSWTAKVIMWGLLIPLRLVIGLAQGEFEYAMLVVVALVIAYATVRRRIPWLIFLLGFPAFLILQPLKAKLRSAVWSGGWESNEISEGDKIGALINTATASPAVLQSFPVDDIISVATMRLANILVFALVVSHTPEDIPYWEGETYYSILVSPIPRFIYPEKTDENVHNTFGHRYGFLQPDDSKTGILITQMVELYGNFGIIGVILGSLLYGALYRGFNQMFLHPGSAFGALVAGGYLFTTFVNIENVAGAIFGSLILDILIILVFHHGVLFTESLLATLRERRTRMTYAPF